eukprot:CAMPEP_0113520480 /NCGR_PEP_ID=MMETSP0014_2-20120614/44106_1 /TAXON_ID=2857 /ORGANISM="Nitzschia sp." /LENGTH=50 /DNA_ID=CAMNT_0000418329 /DNA_START=43 /DNA_END=198 /DNA_ORIENTATION=- /assembly_acc=CAM_ASM_000159
MIKISSLLKGENANLKTDFGGMVECRAFYRHSNKSTIGQFTTDEFTHVSR